MINFINQDYNIIYMIKKRGQVSFEYITIISFGMLILLIAITVFYNYSANSNDSFVISRIDDLGNNLIKNSELLYYSTGKSSSVTLETNIPGNVKEIYFINRTDESEIVISYILKRGYSESVYFVPLRIRGIYNYTTLSNPDKTIPFIIPGDFHTGKLKLQITNVEGGVKIEEST